MSQTTSKNKLKSRQFDSDTLAGIILNWETSTDYYSGERRINGYTIYQCIVNHTSGVFSEDWIDNTYWIPLTDYPSCVKIHPVGTNIPTGYKEMNGDAISRATYANVFKILSTTYGVGDGSTTFNLPDTENDGSFIRHYKSGVSAAIATLQDDAFQGHYHNPLGLNAGAGPSNYTTIAPGDGVYVNTSVFGVGIPTTDGFNGVPRTDSETRPTNLAMIYIIKVL